MEDGAAAIAEKMFCYKYPRPSVTADCVLFGFDGKSLKVLLVRRANEPFKGCWAFPGGFMDMGESAEACASRELREETGLSGVSLTQFHTFSAPERDPRGRVVTVAFYALVRVMDVSGGDDAADARWFQLDGLPLLAFDHEAVLQTALAELRKRLYFEPVGLGVLPDVFAFADLMNLYEAVSGTKLDCGKFYERVMDSGIITPYEKVGTRLSAGECMFLFNEERYMELCNSDAPVGFWG